jgi:hypothetical protein
LSRSTSTLEKKRCNLLYRESRFVPVSQNRQNLFKLVVFAMINERTSMARPPI